MQRKSLIALTSILALSSALLGAAPTIIAPKPPAGTTSKPGQVVLNEKADEPVQRKDPAKGGALIKSLVTRHEQNIEKAQKGGIDLYMLGDSITDMWGIPRPKNDHMANWNTNLGGWNPGDFGIGGDRTQHVLWRITNGELDGVKPKVIVLLIGTNNLPPNSQYMPNTPEEVAGGIKKILGVLREKQPQAKILLMGVFPRADARSGADIMDKINAVNDIIKTYADGTTIKYLNINDKLAPQGKLTKEMMPDLLHPSDIGYQIWADGMRPILTEWLGEPKAIPATMPAK